MNRLLLALLLAALMALATFIIRKLCGKRMATLFTWLGALLVVLPLALVVLFGTMGMLEADPQNMEGAASNTMQSIIDYFKKNGVDILLSEGVGMAVGFVARPVSRRVR